MSQTRSPLSQFILHTPSDKAAKNWISQGYTAERGVVIADLVIGGESHGPHASLLALRRRMSESTEYELALVRPHAFILSMRDAEGQLLPGITVEDMGTKTVANDLDNARVWFDNARLRSRVSQLLIEIASSPPQPFKFFSGRAPRRGALRA